MSRIVGGEVDIILVVSVNGLFSVTVFIVLVQGTSDEVMMPCKFLRRNLARLAVESEMIGKMA